MKIKFAFLPFLLCSIGGIILYLLSFWLLKIKYPVALATNDFNFFIPFFLAIAIVMLLSPYTTLLKYNHYKAYTLLFFLMTITIAIPMLAGQTYIEKTVGEVTQIDKISDINKYPATKYYTVKQYYINKPDLSYRLSYHITGKRNQYFNINLFIIAPMIDVETLFNINSPNVFLTVKHHKEISNNLSDKDKQQQSSTFVNHCLTEFKNQSLCKFTYLERVEHKDLTLLQTELATKPNSQTLNNHFLYPIDKPLEQRAGNSLITMLLSFVFGSLSVLLFINAALINEEYKAMISQNRFSYWKQLRISSFVLWNAKSRFWQLLVYINLLIYGIMAIKTGNIARFTVTELQTAGANYYPLIAQGQWWRLLASIFLHNGIVHIVVNATALYIAGLFLQPYVNASRHGTLKFIAVYLCCGISAGLISILYNTNITSVGASGAILGLFGLLITFLIKAKRKRQHYDLAALIVAVVITITTIVSGLFIPQIDNPAHIGGVITGITIGLLSTPPKITFRKQKATKKS